jgi:hypothetical protein
MSVTIAVSVAFIFIVLLSGALVRVLFTCSDMASDIKALKNADVTQGRRIEQMSAAISVLQSGLLNISNGAERLKKEIMGTSAAVAYARKVK